MRKITSLFRSPEKHYFSLHFTLMYTPKLVLLLIIPSIVFSQRKPTMDRLPTELKDEIFSITPKSLAPSDIRLPFKEVEILDARFDTSKLGFIFHAKAIDLDNNDYRKIKLSNGIGRSLQDFYNDYYQLCFNDTTNKLLIVLKKLWIDNLPSRNSINDRTDIQRNSFEDVHIKFEYYLHRANNYYPIKRVDTIYQLTEENMSSFKKKGLSFFVYCLKSVMEKYDFNIYFQGIEKKKSYDFKKIDSFNNNRFILPILTSITAKPGVYLTFKEFINNTPSFQEYKVNYSQSVLYDKDSANRYYYWAFADEYGMHVKPNKKPDMVRVGNTFEFFIYDEQYVRKSAAGNMLLLEMGATGNGTKGKLVLSPKQVDMETGYFY